MIREGVIFDFVDEVEHLIEHDYNGCRVYIPKSKKENPDAYFWSRNPDKIYFGSLRGRKRSHCPGTFFECLSEEEKADFLKILPFIEELELQNN